MDQNEWSSKMLNIVQSLNSFHLKDSSKKHCKPFIVDGDIIGSVPPYVFQQLETYDKVFRVTSDSVSLNNTLNSSTERTYKINNVLQSLREKDIFYALKGWRNEMYNVCKSFGQKPLFQMERSAVSLFGLQQYGVHINGYKQDKDKNLHMWIARRSYKKPTYPGKLDQIAAGGITAGDDVRHTMIKECQEEASIPELLARHAVSVGAVSYCYEDERGIFPEVEFAFDLELPNDFQPCVSDGEVHEFYCWPIEKVREKLVSGEFKTNCAIIILDFLIRHGNIQPDTEPNFVEFITGIHQVPASIRTHK
ncbi:nudix hydrolase 24, chloroplastic-like [Dendronephthya gigantea]|uniref:nudix hydrolase 24, chloroplastic-like n=1 Tax=Dendronephthya gigantea TaxID=151771 RepID=UPI00106B9B9F|nr:nudix hydrolase 24, chloroplastic-like [Dendronephthya gigantea]